MHFVAQRPMSNERTFALRSSVRRRRTQRGGVLLLSFFSLEATISSLFSTDYPCQIVMQMGYESEGA